MVCCVQLGVHVLKRVCRWQDKTLPGGLGAKKGFLAVTLYSFNTETSLPVDPRWVGASGEDMSHLTSHVL